MSKETLKRYFISSALSFLAGFAVVVVADLDTITLESFQNGAWVGLVFVALRAGLKAVLEGFLSWRSK